MDSQQQKQRADAVKAMVASLGWKHIEEEIDDDLKRLLEELVTENDSSKSLILKSDIRAIKRLFTKIQDYLDIQT